MRTLLFRDRLSALLFQPVVTAEPDYQLDTELKVFEFKNYIGKSASFKVPLPPSFHTCRQPHTHWNG
jgi:hypothetical protein